MRYQALRPLSESLPNGTVHIHAPGDIVENFARWTNNVQIALLNDEYVVAVPDAVEDMGMPPVPSTAVAVAPDAGGHACALCSRAFNSKRSLAMHVTKTHGRG